MRDEIGDNVGKSEQLQVIRRVLRGDIIHQYTLSCTECNFSFLPMKTYSKQGNSFCHCPDCGEVLLVDRVAKNK